jgi:signal transduction histidine kinase
MDHPHSGRGAAAGAGPGRSADGGFRDDASQEIMRASADGIVAVDERGIIRLANPAAGELFARPAGELIGTPFGFPIVAGEAAQIDLVLPGGGRQVVEMRVTTTTWEGERLHVVALRDVTRRTQAERALEVALERQNIVVAVAAHEFHNPLATISVLVNVLRDRVAGLAEEQNAEIIDRIADRTVHLQRLVKKLLTASRIDVEGARGTAERVTVLEVILERLGEFAERSQYVKLSCSPELEAFVDREEFSEMLVNYLENAFAYGRLPVEVSASGHGDRVDVLVCDRGPGVPEAFVPHLFERFSREQRAKEATEGTGLGLWIVYSLARANGGDAWYEPRTDGGACFRLRLRRAPTPETP